MVSFKKQKQRIIALQMAETLKGVKKPQKTPDSSSQGFFFAGKPAFIYNGAKKIS